DRSPRPAHEPRGSHSGSRRARPARTRSGRMTDASPGGKPMAGSKSDRAGVAIVTGAGTGIGRAAALALLADGWQVVLAGRRPAPLDELAAQAGAGRALALPTDVADPKAVARLFAGARDTFGRVDLLFNNAGMGAPPLPLEEL